MDKDVKVLTRLLTTDDGLSKCNTGELFQPRPTYFIQKFRNSDSALYIYDTAGSQIFKLKTSIFTRKTK